MSLELQTQEEISAMNEAEFDSYRWERALADGSGLEVPVITRTQLGQFRDQIQALEAKLMETEGQRDRAIAKLEKLGDMK